MTRDAAARPDRPFLLGVNYWPRASAMAMWTRFDAGEIDEDFARIAALGLDVVRFFILWDAFQPEPRTVQREALERFDRVLATAQRHGLRTMPTLFTGHMSGVNWLPAWTLDANTPAKRFRTITRAGESPYGIGNLYCGALLDAQRILARALGERARQHPAILAWDLGNEFSNLREPDSAGDAAEWSVTLTDDLMETSGLGVTGGSHGEDLTFDRHLRLSSMCAPWTFATMHGYPAYSSFARGPADPEVVPFLAALARTFAAQPVLFSEFGNPTCPSTTAQSESSMGCLDEASMEAYAAAVLRRLHARGALGAFWWCWADYARNLSSTPPFDRAPHELHFGIVRDDGTEKPVARALRHFAQRNLGVVDAADTVPAIEHTYYRTLPDSTVQTYEAYLEQHPAGTWATPQ